MQLSRVVFLIIVVLALNVSVFYLLVVENKSTATPETLWPTTAGESASPFSTLTGPSSAAVTTDAPFPAKHTPESPPTPVPVPLAPPPRPSEARSLPPRVASLWDCAVHNDCMPGICNFGKCVCDLGFTGPHCAIKVEPACEEDRKRYEAFDSIYEKDVWGGSGWGSSLEWTTTIRDFLAAVTRKYAVQSFLDAPVGDYKWMPHVNFSEGMEYVGLDIVRSIVATSRRSFPSTAFWVSDMVVYPPFKAFDLIFCRDALQHLSMADIKKVLRNFNASGSKYLLVTYYSNAKGMPWDIKAGDYRPFSFLAEPWAWAQPLETITDKPAQNTRGDFRDIKTMSLWPLPVRIPA